MHAVFVVQIYNIKRNDIKYNYNKCLTDIALVLIGVMCPLAAPEDVEDLPGFVRQATAANSYQVARVDGVNAGQISAADFALRT